MWVSVLKKIFNLTPQQKIRKKIEDFARDNINVFFVQVGASDGITSDPIHNLVVANEWSGILVEPKLENFEQLKKNYSSCTGLIFENLGISDKEEIKTYYHLGKNVILNDNGFNPKLLHQQGTFDKKILEKNKKYITNFEECILEEKIQCISLKKLLEKHKVKKVDLLVVDAEGHDFKVIKTLDFIKYMPKMVYLEHKHLTQKEKNELNDIFDKQGYEKMSDKQNTLYF